MLNDANASGFKKVYLATGFTDLRCGIDGLANIIRFQFKLDPYDKNTLFLFCGRRNDRIKALLWEGDGFPFDESFICVLKNVVKKEAIEDIELISPKGWGLEGKHVNIDKNTYIVKSEYVEELAEVHLINSRLDISIEDILVALKQINIGRLIIHRHLTYKEKELLETQLEVFPEKINEKIIGNLDEEEILFDINIPIVLVTGISEYTNKFDVQIDLYSRFKKEGYSVGWIGSRKEAVLCGGESIPEWLYGTQLSFKDKIVYFNHYVKEYIEKNKNEVLIIGIPGEVCINDNYFIGHAGELATIISQAVNASATIVCMMFDENIEKKTKIWGNYIEGKLGVQIKCFAITNRLYDYNESDVVRKIKYTTLNNQTIQKMVKIFDGVYMISLDEEKDRLFDALIAELSEEENEL